MDAKRVLAMARSLVIVIVLAFAVGTVADADAASAKGKLKHFRSKSNPHYICHVHKRPKVNRHPASRSWPKHNRPVRVHCVKPKPRHKAHRGPARWVLPRYVVMCESGGNPRIVNRTAAGYANGLPAGLYQITGPTWRAYGGLKFAATADRATVREQGVIALRVLHNQGTRAWACW